MKKKDIDVLLEKLKLKEKNSRQFKVIESRINKSMKQESRFRTVRYNEKSLNISKEISKISEKELGNLIRNIIKKEIVIKRINKI